MKRIVCLAAFISGFTASAAWAEALYMLQAETGQLSFGGPNIQQQLSGDLTQPPAPSVFVHGNSGIRESAQTAEISANAFSVTLDASGFLRQYATIGPNDQQFNTFSQSQAQLDLGYWVVMNDPLGAQWKNAIPIFYQATSTTSIGHASDGYVSSQAHFHSTFGDNVHVQRQCGFNGFEMACSNEADFAVSANQIVSANNPFFFSLQANGVNQAAYPYPGSSSYSATVDFNVLIDPTWQYAAYFDLVLLPAQPGGGHNVPAPGALALLALGLLGFSLRARTA